METGTAHGLGRGGTVWQGQVGAQTRHSQGSRKAGGMLGVRPWAAQLLFIGKWGWGCPESFECRGEDCI